MQVFDMLYKYIHPPQVTALSTYAQCCARKTCIQTSPFLQMNAYRSTPFHVPWFPNCMESKSPHSSDNLPYRETLVQSRYIVKDFGGIRSLTLESYERRPIVKFISRGPFRKGQRTCHWSYIWMRNGVELVEFELVFRADVNIRTFVTGTIAVPWRGEN